MKKLSPASEYIDFAGDDHCLKKIKGKTPVHSFAHTAWEQDKGKAPMRKKH